MIINKFIFILYVYISICTVALRVTTGMAFPYSVS